jgi:RNA polymerase sigma-70 factor (ECF subfamily)
MASESAPHALEAIALAASGLMPTRQLDKAELCAAVRRAIGSLNDRQRMAVLLAKFEHLSYADIAEVMDMSPQAIKSLLSRARCNLREALQPYLDRGAMIDGTLTQSAADSLNPLPGANS